MAPFALLTDKTYSIGFDTENETLKAIITQDKKNAFKKMDFPQLPFYREGRTVCVDLKMLKSILSILDKTDAVAVYVTAQDCRPLKITWMASDGGGIQGTAFLAPRIGGRVPYEIAAIEKASIDPVAPIKAGD